MFSRIASALQAQVNPLYKLRAQLETEGRTFVDLVSGNVNEHGILFPAEILENILAEGSQLSRVYHPHSLGRPAAREAVAAYYRARDLTLVPENIVLTPGTSISYWYAFKLVADEGEEILCPRPSYPLFDYIAALSGVHTVPYHLRESDAWAVDLENLEASISTRTRALVLISPHNPTGHVATEQELRGLAGIAHRHGLVIISDEVFAEFLLEDRRFPRVAAYPAPLVITLNGFSKMFALPGLKLGWMALSGDGKKVTQAMRALELISDTFLPVNEITQAAVPAIFREGEIFLQSYRLEIQKRWGIARSVLRSCAEIRIREPEGGFYAAAELKNREEETTTAALLKEHSLLLHPGYFYDIPPNHLVFSFTSPPAVLEQALKTLARALEIP